MNFFDKAKCTLGFHSWSEWQYESSISCTQIRACKRCPKKNEREAEHKWSEWQYISSSSCIQERRCTRCPRKDETREVHCWGEWQDTFNNAGNAIRYLRKTINTFPVIWSEDAIKDVVSRVQIGIDYYDLQGSNLKEKLISLSLHCKNKELINDLFASLRENLLKNDKDFVPDIQSDISNVKIENLSFESSLQNATCLQKRKCTRCRDKEEYRNKKHAIEEKIDKHCNIYEICYICGKEKFKEERHIWSNWEYQSHNTCKQHRTCQQCGRIEVDEKPKHDWSEWDDWEYLSSDTCQRKRTCKHCSDVNTKEDSHIWSNWEYVLSNSCQRKKICKHCGHEIFDIQHDFTDWTYIDNDTCYMQRICRRCLGNETNLKHQWSEEKNESGHSYNYCKHCKKEEYDITGTC